MSFKNGFWRTPCFLILFFTLLFTGSVQARDRFVHFKYDREDLRVEYGRKMDLEIELSDDDYEADWVILESSLPPGLEMDRDDDEVEIEGRVRFTGRWCFVLGARLDNQDMIQETICLYSQYRETDFDFPRYHSDATLPRAILDVPYLETIEIAEDNRYFNEGIVRRHNLPDNMDAYFDRDQEEFVVEGTPHAEGLFEIIVLLRNERGQENYRQYQLNVTPGGDGEYSCPPGYYYDDDLGYCVQGFGDICRAGTYYDPDWEGCRPYINQCGWGMYFDDFLEICVPNIYPRCPWGYRWSPYSNRCFRGYRACGPGERYNYNQNRCVPRRWHRRCGPNRYWNWNQRRCAPRDSWRRRYRRCGPGWVLNRNYQCVRNRRGCGRGYHYNPRQRRCVRRVRGCGPNRRWDYGRRACVPRRAMRRPGMRRPPMGMRRPPMGMRRPMPRPPMGMRRPMPMPRPPMGMRRPMPMPPRPMAMPMPMRRPMPMPPRPMAMPMPMRRPMPMTMAMRRPMPRPMTMAMRRPMPRPMTMAMRRPMPRPMTMAMRRPMPMPMAMPTSMTRPMRPAMTSGMRSGMSGMRRAMGMRSNLLPNSEECNPLLDENCNTVKE